MLYSVILFYLRMLPWPSLVLFWFIHYSSRLSRLSSRDIWRGPLVVDEDPLIQIFGSPMPLLLIFIIFVFFEFSFILLLLTLWSNLFMILCSPISLSAISDRLSAISILFQFFNLCINEYISHGIKWDITLAGSVSTRRIYNPNNPISGHALWYTFFVWTRCLQPPVCVASQRNWRTTALLYMYMYYIHSCGDFRILLYTSCMIRCKLNDVIRWNLKILATVKTLCFFARKNIISILVARCFVSVRNNTLLCVPTRFSNWAWQNFPD